MTVSYASFICPASIWRIIRGISIRAGQVVVQGASQSPACSLSRRSRIFFRSCRTSSESVLITIPSIAGALQDGTNRPVVSFLTTQIIQDVNPGFP